MADSCACVVVVDALTRDFLESYYGELFESLNRVALLTGCRARVLFARRFHC